MKTNNMFKLVTAVVIGLLAVGASAIPITDLTFGDSRELGFVDPGIPAGDEDVTAYINYLIDMPLNTTATTLGQDFTRSNNDFGALEDAVLGPRVTGPDSWTVDLGSGYLYLAAKYDGPNYGTEVWYVGGLSGVITIPPSGGGTSGTKYGISGISLFNPTSVPDGGSTAILIGLGMLGLGFLRQRLS